MWHAHSCFLSLSFEFCFMWYWGSFSHSIQCLFIKWIYSIFTCPQYMGAKYCPDPYLSASKRWQILNCKASFTDASLFNDCGSNGRWLHWFTVDVSYLLCIVDRAYLYNLCNKPTWCTIFLYVYFYSLHVSGSHVPIIRIINCISATPGICHSV